MKLSEMYPSKYLRGADLSAPVKVTIAKIQPERLYTPGVGEVDGWVLYCERASKGVVLSKGLALSIAQALGADDTDEWIGKQIVLYPQPMRVAGRDLVAIRARAVNGKAGQT